MLAWSAVKSKNVWRGAKSGSESRRRGYSHYDFLRRLSRPERDAELGQQIRDLYDNSVAAYRTATHQTADLVLDTLRLALRKEKKKTATFRQAGELIDDLIYFYDRERIQLKTGVAPLSLRHSA